jgi:thioredoxin 1
MHWVGARRSVVSTVTLSRESFDDTVRSNEVVLADFWAGWCGPCRMFAPVYEEASEAHGDIVFGKVDTEQEQELAARFGIMSIPTLMAFREGVLLYAQPGALPAAGLELLIEKIRALDMDEVRRQLADRATTTS